MFNREDGISFVNNFDYNRTVGIKVIATLLQITENSNLNLVQSINFWYNLPNLKP